MTAKQHKPYRKEVHQALINKAIAEIKAFGEPKAPQNLPEFYALKEIFNLSLSLQETLRDSIQHQAREKSGEISYWQRNARKVLSDFYAGFLVDDRFARIISNILTNTDSSKYGRIFPVQKLYRYLKDMGMLRKAVADGNTNLYCIGIYRGIYRHRSGRTRVVDSHYERLAIEFTVEYGEGLDEFATHIPLLTPEFTIIAKGDNEPWALTNAVIKGDDEALIYQWCGLDYQTD